MLHSLQNWYELNQRTLPWRKSQPNPYEIWISEVMSQQSGLDTVKRYFAAWMREFPSLAALAAAGEEAVLRQWAGLGYYSRARHVLKAARTLQNMQLSGKGWPQSFSEWCEVPGVGPYTAKAIVAIAFSSPVLPLDGNLVRVLARMHGISDPLNRPADLNQIKVQVSALEVRLAADPTLRPGHIAQAFMDLGATVCRPKAAALCTICPIREHGCTAEQNQEVALIPATKIRPASVFLDYVARPLINGEGQVWVEPMGADSPGNLLGQWQIPLEPVKAGSEYWSEPSQVRHAITNHRFRVRVVQAGARRAPRVGLGRWANPLKPEVHLTTLTRKILATFFA